MKTGKVSLACAFGWAVLLQAKTIRVPVVKDLGDYRLQDASPALDTGVTEGSPPVDLENRERPCGGGVDLGAFEQGDCPLRAYDPEVAVPGTVPLLEASERQLRIGSPARELLWAAVRDIGGNARAGVEVKFVIEDLSDFSFPYTSSLTHGDGKAYTVVDGRSFPGPFDDPEELQGTFLVQSGDQVQGPFAIQRSNIIFDGLYGFSGPPLGAFSGPLQVLTGTASPFGEELVGSEVSAWSMDPTLAEIDSGKITAVEPFGPVTLEFCVTAHRLGKTTFIIGTLGYPLYEAVVTGSIEPATFRRGDSNGDGKFDISDPIAHLSYLFAGGAAPRCLDAADANDDGQLDLSDGVRSLDFLFLGGPALPPPTFPACGEDPTSDTLECSAGACP